VGLPRPPQFWAEHQVTEAEPCLWTFASFGHAPAQTWKGWKGHSFDIPGRVYQKKGLERHKGECENVFLECEITTLWLFNNLAMENHHL